MHTSSFDYLNEYLFVIHFIHIYSVGPVSNETKAACLDSFNSRMDAQQVVTGCAVCGHIVIGQASSEETNYSRGGHHDVEIDSRFNLFKLNRDELNSYQKCPYKAARSVYLPLSAAGLDDEEEEAVVAYKLIPQLIDRKRNTCTVCTVCARHFLTKKRSILPKFSVANRDYGNWSQIEHLVKPTYAESVVLSRTHTFINIIKLVITLQGMYLSTHVYVFIL